MIPYQAFLRSSGFNFNLDSELSIRLPHNEFPFRSAFLNQGDFAPRTLLITSRGAGKVIG